MTTSATEFALRGFSLAAQAEVVASHEVGDYAAVYVTSGGVSGGYGELLVLRRSHDSWEELAGGSPARLTWVAFPDQLEDGEVDRCRGLLVASADDAPAGVVEVSLDGRLVAAPVAQGCWVALFVGVYDDATSRVSITQAQSER